MSENNTQSTKDFLFSKEGRGTLITVIVTLIIVIAVGVLVWKMLFGEPDAGRATTDQLASNGSGTVNTRGEKKITTDLTSENLTPEAREAANEYNAESAMDANMHPVPTADDVQSIPVEKPEPEKTKPKATASLTDPMPEYEYEPPNVPTRQTEASQNHQQQVDRQRMRDREQLRKARLKAANDIINTYSQSPKPNSLSFASTETRERSTSQPARVEINDQGGTQFVRSKKDKEASECGVSVVKPGEIRYAVNSIALNTDFKGPVKIEFLDGKVSGWTGMGSFELNEYGAKMKLTIDRMIDPTGTSHSTKAYVLDPETTLWATASDVDYHIIYRYGGFGLATILSGFQDLAEARKTQSEQVGANGNVSTQYREPDSKQITWTLLGSFSELWATAFKDNINRPITVTLDPDTELGVLFEKGVCLSKDDPAAKLINVNQIRRAGFSDPVQ